MKIEEIKKNKIQPYKVAAKHGIKKIYVFGSVARGESSEFSDIDFMIEMNDAASAFGVGGFQFEVQQLLGVDIDVIPTFAFDRIDDLEFAQAVQSEAVAL